jgi:hypothetical protein
MKLEAHSSTATSAHTRAGWRLAGSEGEPIPALQ